MKRLFIALPLIALAVMAILVYNRPTAAKYTYEMPTQEPYQAPAVDKTPVTPETLLAEVNKRRAEAGSPPLALDERLNASAQAKCDEMRSQNYYDHKNPTTGIRGVNMANQYYGNVDGQFGENLTSGVYKTEAPTHVFEVWFKSAPHKTAALEPRYSNTGFGICLPGPITASDEYRTVVEHFYSPTRF